MVKKVRIEQPGRPGRKPTLNAEHVVVLREITLEQPRSSLGEVTRELMRRTGVKACTVPLRRSARRARA